MARIITKEMVKKAIELVRPTAEAILNTEGTTWGPKWMIGYVRVPELNTIRAIFGNRTSWDEGWGEEKDFSEVAIDKIDAAARTGIDTSAIVALAPWLLEEGEYLYAGGVSEEGIAVSMSGAKGRADEAIASILLSTIKMLAHLETERRIGAKDMQI